MSRVEEVNADLREAAEQGYLARCRTALDGGADVRTIDGRGRNAIFAATYGGNVDVLQLLLKQEGAEEAAFATNCNGATPLQVASINRSPESIEMLLARGALRSLNACDKWNTTALMIAAMWNNTECMCILLRAGADPALMNYDWLTAREIAIRLENNLAVETLDEFTEFVSKHLPTLAFALEGLEGTSGLFIPREIINLFLASSFQISF